MLILSPIRLSEAFRLYIANDLGIIANCPSMAPLDDFYWFTFQLGLMGCCNFQTVK